MATAAKLNDIGREEPTGLPFPSLHKPPLNLGERVVWLGNDKPEHGTVWWMGHLPEIAHDWSAGVELDNPVGGIDGCWNGKRLFKCKPCHGILINVNGLIKEDDFLGSGVENVNTPVPYDVQIVEDVPDTITADETVMDVGDVSGPENGPGIVIEQQPSKVALEDSGLNNGDRNIEQFLSAQNTPKLCNASSFDRRVYARMFAECEVEKWYEVLNFAPSGGGDGAKSISVYGFENDDKLQKKRKKKKDSLSPKEGSWDESAKKKERGGIFRFFRWLRRTKSTKMAPVGLDSSGVAPGSRRTLSSVRVSDVVGRRRTKSLESVTSLSRSFHYIPVGVCSTDLSGPPQSQQDSREGLYEDLELDGPASPPSPPKLKCNSLEMPAVAKDSLVGREMAEVSRTRSVRSMCTLMGGSVSSSLTRKKRRAPLPPSVSSGVPHVRSHWIRVLPEVPAVSTTTASASDLSCPKSELSPRMGELNRKIAASTGTICRHAVVTADATGRHMRSASLTPVAPPSGSVSKPVKSPMRIGSHIKNKRKAPQPPVQAVVLSSSSSCSDAHKESVSRFEGPSEAIDPSSTTGPDSPDEFSLKMEQCLEENGESLATSGGKNDVMDKVLGGASEQRAPELPRKTKIGKREHLAMERVPQDVPKATESNRDSATSSGAGEAPDVVAYLESDTATAPQKGPNDLSSLQALKPEILRNERSSQAFSPSEENSSVSKGPALKKLEPDSSDGAVANGPLPLRSQCKSVVHAGQEVVVDQEVATQPKLEAQMNLQALQDLVESLVSQYCGSLSSKLDVVKSKKEPGLQTGKPITGQRTLNNPAYVNVASWTPAPGVHPEVLNIVHDDGELLERYPVWKCELPSTSDPDVKENKLRTSKKLVTSSDESQSVDADDSSDLYEPIGDFLQSPDNESEVDFASGRLPLQPGRRHSSTRTPVDDESPSWSHHSWRTSNSSAAVDDSDDIPKDPFVFWRDLCAREHSAPSCRTEDGATAAAVCHSPSAKVIRRLSVNGQQRLFRGTKEVAIDAKEELDCKDPKLSRGRSLHAGIGPPLQVYENVFATAAAATPHRMVMIDGINMSGHYGGGATVPPYWPHAPLVPYPSIGPSSLHRPFAPFPAFAVVPYGSPMFTDPRFGPVPTAYANPSYSSYACPNPHGGRAPVRGPCSQDGMVENSRQAEVGGVAERKFTKGCDFQAHRSFHHQRPQRESTSSQSGRRKGQSSSPPLTENDTDSDDSSGSGKRTYANVWRTVTGSDASKTYANVPPSPPPRNSSSGGGSSSRLAVGCDWLKKSSKSVEAKVKAARDEPSPAQRCSDARAGPASCQDGDKVTEVTRLASRLQDGLPVDREVSVVIPANDAGTLAESAIKGSVVVPDFDGFVVIGGIRVPTPLNLWPLEYEMIAPELEWLKARLAGNPLPESPIPDDFGVDRLAVNRLLKQLEVAISCGRLEEAATRARDLAQLKIQCSVVQNRKPKGDNQPNPVILNMFVEDKVSHHGPIPIKILPSASVLELKKKIFRDFEFPMTLQRWILGKKLALDDDATLASFGVDSDGCPIFLYLLTPNDVQIKSKDLVWDNEDDAENDSRKGKKKPVPHRPKREKRMCRRKSPALVKEETSDHATSTTERSSSTVTAGNDDCDTAHLGWQCVQCTLINAPFRPVCTMCGTARPKTYVIPINYVISDEEVERLEREKQQEQALKEAEELRRLENWQQYLQLDDQDVIYNTEPFECSICYIEASPGEGVQLRDCLHLFCCDCLRNAIAHCEEAAVKCPYRDVLYSCDSVLQEREIRALVPADVYERYLQRSMTTAESQAKNSFHCKTPDCPGWCIFEDNANEFACPICGHLNCITCRAIHEELNCRQYQDKLMVLARTDEEAKKTRDAIEVMLQKGDAMRCPSCEVVIMKKWGCDWLCCSVCKTEICWVTKGPRWGPKGRGDISGGCKCGTAGVRCHPKCNYCH